MTAEIEVALAAAGVLVLVAVGASKLSAGLGVPAVVVFLGIGMLAGSDGIGGINFEDVDAAQSVGVVALAFILFDGGLSTSWRDVRPVAAQSIALATFGVAITAAVTGAIATWALGVPFEVGLLLGAIVASTDAAAVFSVLRSRNAGLRGRIRPLLELESGINDPMAVFLTVGVLELVTEPDRSVASLVPLFAQQMVVGAAVGLGVAIAAVWVINQVHLEYEGLYPVVSVAVVLLAFAGTELLGGSGFLAVYLAGVVMGNHEFLHRRSLVRFHDALAWLSQIGMFLLLGLLVFPSDLPAVAGTSLLVAGALILLARPLAVFAVLAPLRTDWRDQLMISWVGLRGAVPIILATFPLVEGTPNAEAIFNAVFFIVLTSVLVQGTTIAPVARWLGVAAPLDTEPAYPLEATETAPGGTSLHELFVAPGAPAQGRPLVSLGLPAGVLVVLISRDDEFVIPEGSTTLAADDRLLVLADAAGLETARALLTTESDD